MKPKSSKCWDSSWPLPSTSPSPPSPSPRPTSAQPRHLPHRHLLNPAEPALLVLTGWLYSDFAHIIFIRRFWATLLVKLQAKQDDQRWSSTTLKTVGKHCIGGPSSGIFRKYWDFVPEAYDPAFNVKYNWRLAYDGHPKRSGQGWNRVLVSLISWPGQLLSLFPCERLKFLARMLFLGILSTDALRQTLSWPGWQWWGK